MKRLSVIMAAILAAGAFEIGIAKSGNTTIKSVCVSNHNTTTDTIPKRKPRRNPNRPGHPRDTVIPNRPVNPTKPSNPTSPTTPTNPTNPTTPTNPTPPTNPTSPTTPTTPTNPSNPTTPKPPVR